ncbi:MAG: hypothetical protein LBK04_04275 [Clostridiales Family XIII bacterium]|jgi:hypothetical protein|nr:hypothetical protein [Clostridiales Family XIII bacterium]
MTENSGTPKKPETNTKEGFKASIDEVAGVWAEIDTITSEMTPEEFEAFAAAFKNVGNSEQ